MKGIILLVVGLVLTGSASSLCPYEGNFKQWSNSATWKNNAVPVEGDDVVIEDSVMLDQNADVNSIVVKQGGKLFFEQSPSANLNLRTKHIHIQDGGGVYAGSDEAGCSPYPGKATITLTGNQGDQAGVPNFGEKFIGVEANGVLALHGKEKRPWTRLEKTVEKLDTSSSSERIFYMKVDQSTSQSGLIIYAFDSNTGLEKARGHFKGVRSGNQNKVDQDIDKIKDFLNNDVADGDVTAFAIRKSLKHKTAVTSHDELFLEIEKFCFNSAKETLLRDVEFYDGFSSICVKGDFSKSQEAKEPYKIGGVHQTSRVSLILDDANRQKKIKFDVVSYTSSRGHGKSFAEFENTDAAITVPIINLEHDVSSWQTGDDVVITSTSGDWTEIEHGFIVDCKGACSNNQKKINWTPRNTHLGVVYKRVDMRAMVAVLTRNVKVVGELKDGSDEHGGHIKALVGNTKMRISDTELSHMGQSHTIGHYPIHYHLNGHTGDPLVLRNSVHHSYSRCIVIHGTHNVEVTNNVCFDITGHAIFQEDGNEENLTLSNNFVAGVVRPKKFPALITTDKAPAGYYLTNPTAKVRNNVAGGGEGDGFWWIISNLPTGPSATTTTYEKGQMQRTPIAEFKNNAAYAHARNGLRIFETLLGTNKNGVLNVKTTNMASYNPLEDPLNKNSDPKTALIDQFTGSGNVAGNINLRGGQMEVSKCSLANSVGNAIAIDRRGSGIPSVKDCVIIGTYTHQESSRKKRETNSPVIGYSARIQAVPFEGCYFGDYGTDDGALSPINSNFAASSRAYFKDIIFDYSDPTRGNRVLLPAAKANSRKDELLCDTDGSVTTVTPNGGCVVRDEPFFKTENCADRENWGNLTICDEKFGKVFISYGGSKKEDSVSVYRTDNQNAKMETTMQTRGGFNAILRKDVDATYNPITYLIVPNDMNTTKTKSIGVMTRGIDNEYTTIVAVCLPRKGNVVTVNSMNLGDSVLRRRVCNMQDLYNDRSGGSHYHDENTGIVFFKLLSKNKFQPGTVENCPENLCPSFSVVTLNEGEEEDGWVAGCKDRYFNSISGSSVRAEFRSIVELLEKRMEKKRTKRSLTVPAEIPPTPNAAQILATKGCGKHNVD